MYPEELVKPMRQELTVLGIEETRTGEDVEKAIGTGRGTALVVINSVCGCAAGNARPAIRMALESASAKPDRMITVFAGNDVEATKKLRAYLAGYRPSSPSFAVLRDGEVVRMWERHQIEGREAHDIAVELTQTLEQVASAKTA
jgi:putative YphP/YqiW family bacilliredoxin